jgi:hypothetical protein
MTRLKKAYWTTTGLFCFLILYSAFMYFFQHEIIANFFVKLGYPTYLIYPLATLKVLGVITLLTNFNERLKELAYTGFFFNIILAFFAHFMIKDGGQGTAIIAFVLLISSYIMWKKMNLNE